MQQQTNNQNTAAVPAQPQAGIVNSAQNQPVNQTPAQTAMPGLARTLTQVEQLRETLQELMMDEQYADGEILTASAGLDQELQNYERVLSDKKQPSMRTF